MSQLASPPLTRLWRQCRTVLVYGTLLLGAAIWQHRGYAGACAAAAVCAAVIGGARTGTVLGAATGLLWDTFAERQVAYHVLLLTAVCAVVGMLSDSKRLRGLTGALLSAAAAGVLCAAVQGMMTPLSYRYLVINVGGTLGWTLLFYPILRRARRWLNKRG